MKQLFLILLFISASGLLFAQLDAVKPSGTTPKKTKTVNPGKPSAPVRTGSYIIVYRGGQFASALTNYSIFIDGKRVCKLSNGRFFKYPVSPGKHEIEAKKAGVDIMKKETFISVVSAPGRNNYISCNIKTSVLRERIEMSEVVESSGRQSVNNLKEDNCQSDIGHN